MSELREILVVYDSRRGHVERLAGEVVTGVQEIPQTDATLVRAPDVDADQLLACHGLIVGSPVHSGTVSVPIKQFFDDWYLRHDFYPSRPMRDRVGAAFAAGGQAAGGREFTLMTILVAMLHHRMLVVSGDSPLGASAATEAKAVALDDTELGTARELGRRVAEVVHKLSLPAT